MSVIVLRGTMIFSVCFKKAAFNWENMVFIFIDRRLKFEQ